MLPLTRFSASVCWVLLSGIHCRLLETEKTEGNKGCLSLWCQRTLFHGVCLRVCFTVCVCVCVCARAHIHLRFLESLPGLSSPSMGHPEEIFWFKKLNWCYITMWELALCWVKHSYYLFKYLQVNSWFSTSFPSCCLGDAFGHNSSKIPSQDSTMKWKQDGLWTPGLCWGRISNCEIY